MRVPFRVLLRFLPAAAAAVCAAGGMAALSQSMPLLQSAAFVRNDGASAAGAGAAATQAAADAATSQHGLPLAPSAVMYPQYGMGAVAGSGKLFVTTHTQTGADGIVIERPAEEASLPLSIDDAVSYALTRNARLLVDKANDKIVRGYKLQTIQALFPTVRASASSEAEELNLAAMGFSKSSFEKITIPGFNINTFSTIVKVDVTQAQLSLSQQLFNLPDFELYQASKDTFRLVELNTLTDRGNVVNAVLAAYLQGLADNAMIENARANERSAKQLFDNATAKRQAGVGTSLDQLRGQVEYQQREQQRIAAEAQQVKDVVQLDRIMGLPADQALTLTDQQPYAQLADMDLARAYDTALLRRKDYLAVLAEIRLAEREQRAVKYERLPTVAFNGYYGVVGQTEGLYHGVFNASGSVRFPIFREASLRGENEVVAAELMQLREQVASLRTDINVQIRANLLDVQANNELVQTAQSQLTLAQQELSDENDRFAAGVDDNLPVVRAQTSVAAAQANLVQALYQFNASKIALARSTGIVESQYRAYLGK